MTLYTSKIAESSKHDEDIEMKKQKVLEDAEIETLRMKLKVYFNKL